MLLSRFPIIAAAIFAAMSAFFLAPTPAMAADIQCVPFARQASGIQIYGDAHTWWKQAAGKYARGSKPQIGAVMAFKPYRNSRLGHVAYVSKIIDSRKVMISHSNWSLINGRRGQIERNVPAIDVSPNNDWSEVRVWYHSIQALGGTQWPLHGFIYNDKPGAGPRAQQPAPRLARKTSSKAFLSAFSGDFAGSSSRASAKDFDSSFGSGFKDSLR